MWTLPYIFNISQVIWRGHNRPCHSCLEVTVHLIFFLKGQNGALRVKWCRWRTKASTKALYPSFWVLSWSLPWNIQRPDDSAMTRWRLYFTTRRLGVCLASRLGTPEGPYMMVHKYYYIASYNSWDTAFRIWTVLCTIHVSGGQHF